MESGFQPATIEVWSRLQILILCYSRKHEDSIASDLLQIIKSFFFVPLTHSQFTFLSNIRYDHPERIFRWPEARLLQSGGFGKVLIGECKANQLPNSGFEGLMSGQSYCIKVIPKPPRHKPANWQRIAREIEILRVLRSIRADCFIALYDVFQTEQDILLCMEHGGDELLQWIDQYKYLTEDQASQITKSILHALSILHKYKIVHRDLKPDNVLIDKNTRKIKIIDFGFAKFFGKAKDLEAFPIYTHLKAPLRSEGPRSPGASAPSSPTDFINRSPGLGTVPYMAPELLDPITNSSSRLDMQKIDVFAVGVIVYVMLSGKFPFRVYLPTLPGEKKRYRPWKDIAEQIRKGVQFTSESFKGVSDNVKDFIQNLLHRDRKLRPDADMALLHSWIKEIVCPNKLVRPPLSESSNTLVYNYLRSSDEEKTNGKPNIQILLQLPMRRSRVLSNEHTNHTTSSTTFHDIVV